MFDNVLRELRTLERGVRIPVEIELDDKGYLDRRCPSDECGRHFKVMFEDWRNIIRDEVVYCPVCRHDANSSAWNTAEQLDYLKNVGIAYMQKKLSHAFQNDARTFNLRQSQDNFVRMNMSYRTGHIPTPVLAQATDIMSQEFKCDECNCRYSSIGAAFFCPSCGHNSVLDTFANSVETVKKTVATIPQIRQIIVDSNNKNVAEDAIRHICENGLCKLVSSFQKYAEASFHKLPNSNQFSVARNLFQRLMESDTLWRKAASTGYTDILNAAEFQALKRYFQQRHLLEHQDGIIDQQYIDRANDRRYNVGQRLIVTESNVSELATMLLKLSSGIAALI